MNILLLGPHGAGKSTQAHLLSASLHIPYLSTGEMLRSLASQSTQLGTEIRQRLERGEYMSDAEMIPLVDERLSQLDAQNGFILEGYPRTLIQAQSLKAPIHIALNIHLTYEESMSRLLARKRTDDTPEIIARRLDHHLKDAVAIQDYYQQQGILHQVDGNQPVEAVQQQLLELIHALGS